MNQIQRNLLAHFHGYSDERDRALSDLMERGALNPGQSEEATKAIYLAYEEVCGEERGFCGGGQWRARQAVCGVPEWAEGMTLYANPAENWLLFNRGEPNDANPIPKRDFANPWTWVHSNDYWDQAITKVIDGDTGEEVPDTEADAPITEQTWQEHYDDSFPTHNRWVFIPKEEDRSSPVHLSKAETGDPWGWMERTRSTWRNRVEKVIDGDTGEEVDEYGVRSMAVADTPVTDWKTEHNVRFDTEDKYVFICTEEDGGYPVHVGKSVGDIWQWLERDQYWISRIKHVFDGDTGQEVPKPLTPPEQARERARELVGVYNGWGSAGTTLRDSADIPAYYGLHTETIWQGGYADGEHRDSGPARTVTTLDDHDGENVLNGERARGYEILLRTEDNAEFRFVSQPRWVQQ